MTVAVLACGVDRDYPPGHYGLLYDMPAGRERPSASGHPAACPPPQVPLYRTKKRTKRTLLIRL